jgi:hypothetical protein
VATFSTEDMRTMTKSRCLVTHLKPPMLGPSMYLISVGVAPSESRWRYIISAPRSWHTRIDHEHYWRIAMQEGDQIS